jgi:hypothetical protein
MTTEQHLTVVPEPDPLAESARADAGEAIEGEGE